MDSPATLAALDRTDALRADLDAMRPLDADRLGAAVQRLRIEWTYHSNAIEGNSLTYGETRALLMHGVTADGKPLKDHLDIQGHREALDYLEQVVRSDAPLTLAAVREMHGLLLGEPYETWAETPDGQRVRRTITPGEFKAMPNHVRTETGETHYYARPEEVPALMQSLVDVVRDGAGTVHPVVFASDVHHRFAAIHPFDDGNGRMARLLMNLVLMRAGYPPAVLRQENRPAYYGALAAADGGDLGPLVRFVASELEATMALYLRALRGEPDPDEFGRRLALLKREVETRAKVWNRSSETLASILSGVIEPLVARVDIGVRDVAPLFGSVAGTRAYTVPNIGTLIFGDGETPQVPRSWTIYNRVWQMEGYQHDLAARLTLSITAEAELHGVALTSSLVGDLALVRYGYPLNPEDTQHLADRVLVALVGQVEAIDRKAEERRQP